MTLHYERERTGHGSGIIEDLPLRLTTGWCPSEQLGRQGKVFYAFEEAPVPTGGNGITPLAARVREHREQLRHDSHGIMVFGQRAPLSDQAWAFR